VSHRGVARKRQRVDPLHELRELLQRETGIRMPAEKRAFLECRLERRLRALQLDSLEEYWNYFQHESETELKPLIDAVTTNKTDFYREPAHFEFLLRTALPKLLRTLERPQLRVWCAGCSTGEEPYTLAMVLSEALRDNRTVDFRILATDISTRVLSHAKQGIYDEVETDPLPPEWRKRYVGLSKDRSARLARVRPELRRKVSFHRLNFMDDSYPVEGDFHIIFFRNVAIYFERDVQRSVVRKLIEHLVLGGYFFMGHSESLQGKMEGLRHVAPSVFERV
jgi:chemotaxis protein methyltransferase CheR